MASGGPYGNLHLTLDKYPAPLKSLTFWRYTNQVIIIIIIVIITHASTPTLNFLQAGCPSCHPTNSVRALKAIHVHTSTYNVEYKLYGHADDWASAKTSQLWRASGLVVQFKQIIAVSSLVTVLFYPPQTPLSMQPHDRHHSYNAISLSISSLTVHS